MDPPPPAVVAKALEKQRRISFVAISKEQHQASFEKQRAEEKEQEAERLANKEVEARARPTRVRIVQSRATKRHQVRIFSLLEDLRRAPGQEQQQEPQVQRKYNDWSKWHRNFAVQKHKGGNHKPGKGCTETVKCLQLHFPAEYAKLTVVTLQRWLDAAADGAAK